MKDVVSVKDFGVVGDGVTDDTTAIQAAINNSASEVYFPAGKYIISDTLLVSSNTRLVSWTGAPPTTVALANNDVNLVFTNQTENKSACFTNTDPLVPISNFCISGISIIAQEFGGFNWAWIFEWFGALSHNYFSIKAENKSLSGGVYKSTEIVGSPSWVQYFDSCIFKLADTTTQYIVDHVHSDSYISNCYFTGGKGVIDRGTGGNLYVGCHFDRTEYSASSAGITLARADVHATSGGSQKVLSACYFDLHTIGVKVDTSVNVGANNLNWGSIITGCIFRNETNTDIQLENNVTYTTLGCVITNNTFTGGTSTSIDIGASWDNVTIVGNRRLVNTTFNYESKDFSVLQENLGVHQTGGPLFNVGNETFRSQTAVSGFFGSSKSGNGLVLGSLTGNTPFIGASRDSGGTATALNFFTDNTKRLVLAADGSSFYPNTGGTLSLGQAGNRWSDVASIQFSVGASGVPWTSGTGSPEGVVTAIVGALYSRTDGGAGTTLYVKESGTGNTGWVAK